MLVLSISLPQTRPLIIVNTYRTPSGKINEAVNHLNEILEQIPNNSEIYIMGDLNIDLSNNNSPSSKKVLDSWKLII